MAFFRSNRPSLRDGEREYILLEFHEPLPPEHEPVALGDTWRAERRLRDFAQDYFNLRTLRELIHTHAIARPFEPFTEEQVVRQAAMLFSRGQVRLARAPLVMVPGTVPPLEKKATEEAAPVEEKVRLMIQVVDDVTEDPISDLELNLKLPDGSEKKVKTDDDGRIELSDLTQGRVKVTTVIEGATLNETLAFAKAGVLPALQPAGKKTRKRRKGVSGSFLARIISHKVSDGETLESIAESYELTADALAKFNWGTTDPEKIQSHLLIDVGCTTKDDSGKFVLSSEDNPGIIYVARPLDMDWVALEQRHIWRVKKLPEPRLYLFSA
ncbi:LysM peptidoglycan-binding domain-containing protein [Vitiosangium sp. GDMCC 1.1324]|uniref:LysM peptidoglycan-binding domain-containing protein n=1 Tax=Vitiosangium sp. (strain GDMCC 1.1324) TaxID=2138576 RepID=UPI000D37E8CF|nr:LysM peptidoglycan-binding domain-containing protein [Vitiosangium sp. GDMCC 1.1324]PTL77973.1 LysM domain-containing protein [Vitiosangium sp. GDMCC 1.1324]